MCQGAESERILVDVLGLFDQVRDKVASVRNKLPTSIKEPVISKVDPSAQPIMVLAITSEVKGNELYDLANDPQEMDNRFGDPGVAKAQRELMDMIASRPDDKVDPLPQVGMA